MSKLPKKKNKKKLDYFESFCKQIELATKEAKLLQEVTKTFEKAEALDKNIAAAHVIENDADAVCHSIYDAILPDFVTPIDREDILSLTNSLDDLTDQIEEVIQSFYMYDIHFMPKGAETFADITVKCCDALLDAMKDFSNFKKAPKKLQANFTLVNDLEDEADALYMQVMRFLFTEDRENAMRVLVWSRIYTIMEDVVDTCESIAELMNCIVLKHG